ncbi:MAG: histidine phosphatase family protein [Flavobacteriaceae bacterium]
MKKLVFIRHGKSSWEYPVLDVERPLKSRGITDASIVCDEFLKYSFKPDLVVSSPAKRAYNICKIFTKKMEISSQKIQINPTIYDFEGSKTADFIKTLDNNYQNVMLFGHNFAFTNLVNRLGNRYIENLPTSGLVLINFDVDSWQEVNSGITEMIIFPSDLKKK